MGILSILSVGAEALKAQQLALQTTGHNLANAATPGYSRQRVDLVSADPAFEGGVFVGQGVQIAGIGRIVDRFVESELLTLHGEVGYSQAESEALESLQEIFPTTGGVNGALSEFFGALSDLANHPGGLVERVSVIAKGRALGESLGETRQLLSAARRNLDQDLKGAVERINVVLEQIAGLNRQIGASEADGASANDLRDKRQTLLQEITALTGATTREDSTGQVTVSFGGLFLVGGDRFASFKTDQFDSAGLRRITYTSPDGTDFDATALLAGGRVGSLLDLRDRLVVNIIDQIDQFAKTLVDEVNAQHALGFDLNGNAGGSFFAPIAAVAGAAGQVQVDAAVASDPRLIAAAAAALAVPGDNRNALALVNLRQTPLAALGDQTLEDHYLSLIAGVGAAVEGARMRFDFHQGVLTGTQARRESVSGVNMDEEMTKLIQFQRAFEAASLLVRTADEMYQTLIEMVG
jgi:flagellar hook-associated protein 1 FlgK